MSDTPKTDELISIYMAKRDFVPDGLWIRHARELERENAALRADIHAHEQINKQLIEDKRRLDYMEQNIDFISWRFYGKPHPFDLRGTIDAKRKEAQP